VPTAAPGFALKNRGLETLSFLKAEKPPLGVLNPENAPGYRNRESRWAIAKR
jgi:hypothetical protein